MEAPFDGLLVEMNLGHAHKTRFWYLLGVFSKISDEHPRHFYTEVPPGLNVALRQSTRDRYLGDN